MSNKEKKLSAALQLPVGWWKKLVLFGLAVFFINIGIDHFINPDFYFSMPTTLEYLYIPSRKTR